MRLRCVYRCTTTDCRVYMLWHAICPLPVGVPLELMCVHTLSGMLVSLLCVYVSYFARSTAVLSAVWALCSTACSWDLSVLSPSRFLIEGCGGK